jgi:FixJ family two-component response regulator
VVDPGAVIFVIDDDASVRGAVKSLLKSVGLRAEAFASTGEFLAAGRPDVPSCLVLDVQLPETNGLEFHKTLEKAGIHIPVVFITAHGDIPMTSRAMKAGAVEFLAKPFQKKDLLAAIEQGLARDRAWRAQREEVAALQSRFLKLTAREREVMDLVVSGMPNKQIAAQLNLSEITVKLHRSRVMQKTQVDSLAELVRITERLRAIVPR